MGLRPTEIKRKWILITGASSGLGLVYAQEFARLGANLVLASRNSEKLESLAQSLKQEFSIEVDVISIDLSHPGGAENLFAKLIETRREIFGLINNAGVGVFGRLGESSLVLNQQEILLNVYSLTTLAQLFIRSMAKRGSGFIINVASVAAFGPAPYMANYAASKAYVLSFSISLWAEYRKSGVRILAVCPGVTDTGFFDVVGAQTLAGSSWRRDPPLAVVRDTLHALGSNKPVVIAGSFRNRALALISNFLPSRWIAQAVAYLHES